MECTASGAPCCRKHDCSEFISSRRQLIIMAGRLTSCIKQARENTAHSSQHSRKKDKGTRGRHGVSLNKPLFLITWNRFFIIFRHFCIRTDSKTAPSHRQQPRARLRSASFSHFSAWIAEGVCHGEDAPTRTSWQLFVYRLFGAF